MLVDMGAGLAIRSLWLMPAREVRTVVDSINPTPVSLITAREDATIAIRKTVIACDMRVRGMYLNRSTANIVATVISNCSSGASDGGGIRSHASVISLQRVLITHCVSGHEGGGMFIDLGTLVVQDSLIIKNKGIVRVHLE